MPVTAFVLLISAVAGYLFMSPAPMTDAFMAQFGVGHAGLSFFLGALLWSHSLVQLPAGLLLDRLGVYRGFLLAAFVSLFACLMPFIAPENLLFASAMRFIAGIGSGLLFLASIKFIGMTRTGEKLANAQGWQGAFFCIGIMLPYFSLPYLGHNPWRYAYLIPAALVLIMFLLSFGLPRSIRQPDQATVPAGGLHSLLKALLQISTSREIWALGIFHGLSYGTLNNLGQWLPQILGDLSDNSHALVWQTGAGAALFAGTVGRAFGGRLLRWWSRNSLSIVTVMLIAVLYIGMGTSSNPWVVLVIAVILALLGGLNYGSLFSLTSQTVSIAYLATAAGFMNLVGNLVNVLMSLLLGTVREYVGSFAPALLGIGIFAVIACITGRKIIARIGQS